MLKLPQTQDGGFVQQIVEVRILHRIDIAFLHCLLHASNLDYHLRKPYYDYITNMVSHHCVDSYVFLDH